MSSSRRTPGSKRELKRRVLEQLIDRRIAHPWRAVPPGTIKGWFPAHEQPVAMAALMELLAEDTPVDYATPAETVWLEDLSEARELLEDLERTYPHWFQ